MILEIVLSDITSFSRQIRIFSSAYNCTLRGPKKTKTFQEHSFVQIFDYI